MKLKFNSNKHTIQMLLFGMLLLTVGVAYSQPVANFTSNIKGGCSPILVNFTDQSTGNPTEWKWDLGNGTISNLKNPSATYFNPGVYMVKLLVKNAQHQDSIIKTNYINVSQAPNIDFLANGRVGCNPLVVTFTNQTTTSLENIASWQWDFGDGIISNQQNPSHTYTTIGAFSISLKVTTTAGCMSAARKEDYITNNRTIAGFSNKVAAICTPKNIQFQNTSISNGSMSFYWDFGDGDTSTVINPMHVYSNDGNYTVKLITKSVNGCIDSIAKNLLVINPVSANFTSNASVGCKVPFNAAFNNPMLAGNTYLWNFGDSTFSTLPNPSHNYTDTGNYAVKLVVKNINGCADSIRRMNFIKIQKPLFGFENIPDSSCLSFTKTIAAITNPTSTIVDYKWDLGDGATSTDKEPTHTFNNPGYFTVSLIGTAANGCKDTITMPNAIRITTKPSAAFSANIFNTCASTEVVFTNLSSNSATKWEWDFGDNSNSTEKNPKHIYKDTGYITVKLVAINGGCSDTAIYKKYIYIKPAVAKFTFSLNCINALERKFHNLSIGATRFLWDFGDGTLSTESSPLHSFPNQGIFSVKLIAFNDSSGCSYTTLKTVRIINIIPDFYASDSIVCKDRAITFSTALSNMDVARFFWDFGDGLTENTRNNNTAHSYLKTGKYTVQLITINFLNCRDTLVKSMYINVLGPKAKFGVKSNTCFGTPVLFADSSAPDEKNTLKTWIWNYGDGVIDSFAVAPYQHIYTNPKAYNVVLKVIDAMGCSDTFKLPFALNVSKVSARFYVADTFACSDMAVKFICPYWTAGIAYNWDFGDSITSKLQLPTHKFKKDGMYSVKLLVTDARGCKDSSSLQNIVRVVNPVANFTMSDSFKTCPPLIIQFNSNSLNSLQEYWDFGDSSYSDAKNPSHFYTYPGVYTATMFSKGRGGCISKMQKQITVNGPKGILTYDPLKLCKPYMVNFNVQATDAVTYVWDFNDGVTAVNNNVSMQHTYLDSGVFLPKIMLIDNIGCKVPINGKDTLTNVFATAKFEFNDSILCNQKSLQFTNTSVSNDSLAIYKWDFGDGNLSNQFNPVHQFANAGLYYPSLTVITKAGCTNKFKSLKSIKAAISSNVGMQIGGNGCVPLSLEMSGVVLSQDTSAIQWQWAMGNGNTKNGQMPGMQLYDKPGKYNVKLTAINGDGCIKTIEKIVEAYGAPLLSVTPEAYICKGQSVTLNVGGASSYKWSPAINLNCTNCNVAIASPTITAVYKVIGTSNHGCTSTDSVKIYIKQPFKMTYSKPATLCAGQIKRLSANGAATYSWSPAKGLNSTTIANPEVLADSNITYRVIGTDEKGCFKDTGYVALNVYPIPTVNAGEDKTITAGSSIDLEAIYSDDVTAVNWTPTGDLFRNNDNAITVKPTVNTTYTVEVRNNGGCAARDKINVLVVCNGSNVFLPNLFSPNGDGANDVFYPRGTGLYKIKTLKVFNRWGETVFAKSNFTPNDPYDGWDGTYKGAKLNADTFVYIMELICVNNSVLTLRGNIALVR